MRAGNGVCCCWQCVCLIGRNCPQIGRGSVAEYVLFGLSVPVGVSVGPRLRLS